jgi:hypothetical protein
MIRESTQFSNSQLTPIGQRYMNDGFVKMQQDEINQDLHDLGAVRYDFWLPETHVLPYIIEPDERIKGIVYGHYTYTGSEPAAGRGALIVTNRRILLIDKKPLFLKCDELRYGVVTGVTYTRVGVAGTVTLHSRAGDIQVRTLNQKCAAIFVRVIEEDCFNTGRLSESQIVAQT